MSVRNAIGLTSGALAGLAGVMSGKAVSAASDFQDALVEVQKVTDAKTAAAMSDEIRNMAETIPLTTTELADLTAQAARFGVRGNENLRNFTESAARMAFATDVSASKAGEAFAKLTTLTETPVSKVENLGSSINLLSNTMATSSQEIVDSALRSAGTLSQLGLTAPNILGLSAAINEASESSERAGTRMRRLAQELTDPSRIEAITRAYSGFGQFAGKSLNEVRESIINMRNEDPVGFMRMLADTIDDNTKAGRNLRGAMTAVSRQALTALGQNAEGVTQGLKNANKEFERGTSLTREYEAQVGTFKSQVQLLKNSLNNVAITVGNAMLPTLTKLVTRVNTAVDWFQEWNKATDGVAAKNALLAGQVGLAVTAIASFSGPLGAAAGALAGFGYAYKENIAGIGDEVRRIAGVFSDELAKSIRAVRKTLDAPIWDAWRRELLGVNGVVSDFVDLLGSGVVKGIRTLGRVFRNDFLPLINKVASEWYSTFQTVKSEIVPIITDIAGVFAKHVPKIEGVIEDVGDALKDVFIFRLETVHKTVRKILRHLGTAWQDHKGEILPVIEDIASTFDTLSSTALTTLRDIKDTLRSTFVPAIRAAGDTVGDILEGDFVGAFEDVRASAVDALQKISTFMSGRGKTAIVNGVKTLSEAVQPVFETAFSFAGTLGSVIKDFFADVRAYLTNGQARADILTGARALGTAFESALSASFGVGGVLWGLIEDYVNGVSAYIQSGQAKADLTSAFDILGIAIKTTISTYFTVNGALWNVVEDFFDSLRAYIESGRARTDLTSALSSLGSVLKTTLSNDFALAGVLGTVITDFFADLKSYMLGPGKDKWVTALRAEGDALKSALKTSFALSGVLGSVIKDFFGDVKVYLASGQAQTKTIQGLRTLGDNAADTLRNYFSFEHLYGRIVKTYFDDVAAYIGTGGAATDLKNAFGLLGDGIRTVVKGIFALEGGLGAVIQGWVTALSDYIGSGQAKTDIKSAFHLLGQGIRSTVLMFFTMSGGLGGVVKAFIGELRDYIGSGAAAEDLHSAFYQMGSSIRTVFVTYFKVGGKFWQLIGDFISAVANWIGSGQAKTDIKTAFNLLGDAIVLIVKGLFKGGGTLWTIIGDFFSDFYDYVGSGKAFQDMKHAFGLLIDMVFAAFDGLYEGLIGHSTIPDMFGAIQGFIAGTGRKWVKRAVGLVVDAIQSAFEGVKEAVVGSGGIIPQMMSDVASAAGNAITNLKNQFDNVNWNIDWPDPPSYLGGGDGGSSSGGSHHYSSSSGSRTTGSFDPGHGVSRGGNPLFAGEFARGGIVNRDSFARVAEAGPEAIAPLNKLPGLLADAAAVSARRSGGRRGGGTAVTMHIDTVNARSKSEADEAMDNLLSAANSKIRR